MILAMDVGNTNIEVGLLPEKPGDYTIIAGARYFTKLNCTSDELAFFILDFLKHNFIEREEIKRLIFSSVVPPLDNLIKKMYRDYFNSDLIQVNNEIRLGIRNCYSNPAEVGSDRLITACYVYDKFKKNSLIVDMGTATTLCALTKEGDYLGGIIIPGVRTALNALTERAAKLPAVTLEHKEKLLSSNTVEALEAGIYFSTYYALEGVIKRLAKEVGFSNYLTVGTGGYTNIFKKDQLFDIIDDKLSIKGLKVIADLNRS